MKAVKIMRKILLNSFVSALAVAGVLSLSHSAIAMSDESDDSKHLGKDQETIETIERCLII